jgi:hypothetical protein
VVTHAEDGRTPKPPFGLRGWTPSADAAAVLLDARAGDLRSAWDVAQQVPLASTLPAGAPLIVLGTAAPSASVWRWLVRDVAISRAARCSALLARGYVDIGAGTDEVTGAEFAWGYAPRSD